MPGSTRLPDLQRTPALPAYETVFATSPEALLVVGPDGVIRYANRRAEQVFGYAAGLAGNRIDVLVPVATRDGSRAADNAKPGPGNVCRRPGSLGRRQDGSEFPVEVVLVPLAGGDVLTSVRGESPEADPEEERLRARERRALTFVEHAGDGLFLHDANAVVLDVNPAACRSLGYTRDELVGMAAWDIDPDWTPELDGRIRGSIARGETLVIESRHRRKDGTTFPVEIRLTPFEENGVRCVMAVVRDLTDRRRMEARLRDLDVLLRDAGEQAKVGGWFYDPATRRADWTAEVARTFGLSPHHRSETDFTFDTYQGEDRARIATAFQAAVEQGVPYDLELEIRTPAGEQKWVRSICRPVVEDGKVVLLRGALQDVTDRKRAEARIRETKAFVRSILDSLAASVAVLDRDGVIVAVNRIWQGTVEAADTDLTRCGVGTNYLDVCRRTTRADAAVAAAVADGIAAVLRGQRDHFAMDYQFPMPGSRSGWFTLSVTPLGVDGRGAVISHWDITERREAENAVRESEERHRRTLSALREGVVMLDHAGRVGACNEAGLRMLGLPPAGSEGAAPVVAGTLTGEAGQLFTPERYPWEVARQSGEPQTAVTLNVTRPDGTGVRLLVNAHPIGREGGGPPYAVVVSLSDVTARWQAEENLQRHQADLAHAARYSTIGEMAAILVHELNQPLHAVVNFCRGAALRLAGGPAEIVESLDLAAAEAHRAAEIVRRLRDFVRKREPHRSTVSVNEVVEQTLAMVRPVARSRQVPVTTGLAGGLPPVFADPIQIEQVLVNLIRNAIEAMASVPEGERRLKVETEAGLGGRVTVRVTDSGCGIPPPVMSRLFEPFHTTKSDGMGLGLAISRGIVESHGGRLDAAPSPGGGTVFWFTLPGSRPEPTPAPRDPPSAT